ncbi:hypothetical protein [Nocardioides sp. cx-173]|uniref:hypothetical protein n=1 Tax=Nocardioides sp. cx-173 TaxID=2898796 RepID=UPI001E48D9D5|nr:hypothetical protein [Nocardioides sp. cx-173]MCD4524563.1 hypothetical protein [Nocardioides sp. cx-173]UGB42952.1 hypothetical protein LQ940_05370 [Nocardioides sp. cx-173]
MTDARRAAAALLACVAGLTLVSCGDEEAATEVVPAASGASIDGEQSEVQLPHGRLTFEVTDAEEVTEDDAPDAGTSGRFVGVDWTWEPGAGVPPLVSGFLLADDVEAAVRVQVDGTWHDLGPAYDTAEGGAAGTAFFVPAGDDVTAGDVRLAVDFDGVEQTVQGDGSGLEAGAAAAMYELTGEPVEPECPVALQPQGVAGEATCTAAFVELPYVTGLGWAATGTTWIVADLSVTATGLSVAGQDQPIVEQTETATLDGVEPASVLLDEASGAAQRTQSVYAGEPGAERRLSFTRNLSSSQRAVVAKATGEVVVPAA